MCITGSQHKVAQALQARMRHNRFHQPFAQSAAAVGLIDKHIGQVTEGGLVGDHAGKANLPGALIYAKANSAVHRFTYCFNGNIFRPVGAGKKSMYIGDVQLFFIGRDAIGVLINRHAIFFYKDNAPLLPYLCPMQVQDDLQARWWKLEEKLMERFGKKPDMESILFLVGVQELGDIREKFTKEQKQDLMHVAVCTLLTPSGFYEMEGADEDGWPHFRQLKPLPVMDLREQENFMKDHVLLYFANNGFLE